MELTPHTSYVTADDGTRLAVHLAGGDGPPLVCVPGGPMLDSSYLGDLGGLAAHHPLALLDPRGTGESDASPDPAAYRCDRLGDDLEAVRRHLGLERLDLLGHSAGANVVYRYAERYPDRVGRLVLVTPSLLGVGVEVSDLSRMQVARLRQEEPWYDDAVAALGRVQAGTATDEDWEATTPLSHGRWDEEARALEAEADTRRNPEVIAAYSADGAFDPPTTRDALSRLEAPVLVLGGGWDVGNPLGAMAEVAALFPRGELVVQPEAGHYPWRDDPAAFLSLVLPFLR